MSGWSDNRYRGLKNCIICRLSTARSVNLLLSSLLTISSTRMCVLILKAYSESCGRSSCFKFAHLRQSTGCTEIQVKKKILMLLALILHIFFHICSPAVRSCWLDKFSSSFIILKVGYWIFRVFDLPSPSHLGERGQVRGLILMLLKSPFPIS